MHTNTRCAHTHTGWRFTSEILEAVLQWAALSLYSETGTGKTFLLAHATIICVNSFVSFFLTRPQKLRTTDAILMWDSVCDIFCT